MSQPSLPSADTATLLDTPHADLWLRIAAVAVEMEALKRDLRQPAQRDCRVRLAEVQRDKRRRPAP